MSGKQFKAGRLKHFVHKWSEITKDKNILDIVQHCPIEFLDDILPCQQRKPYQPTYNNVENKVIDEEITKLLQQGVIKETNSHNKFLSTIFVRPKKNGEYRMILNLKKLNEYIPYKHFKMDTFESALFLISKGTYMASIDLRHAYYSIPIAEKYQRFLCFTWNGKCYSFVCMPNGIAFAPRLFTKLLKPVYACLREKGFKNVGYIDDSLLCAENEIECSKNVEATKSLFTNLGFMIHRDKSVLKPTKEIVFLGNIINSDSMTVTLPAEKKEVIEKECKNLLRKDKAKIREVARVLGLIVSSFSAVDYSKLHYRDIEIEKIKALKRSHGDFEALMIITPEMKQELNWWVSNIFIQNRKIRHDTPTMTIHSDSSMEGWGATLNTNDCSAGGRWTDSEQEFHINYLEMMAILLALKSFLPQIKHKHILVLCDNMTAVSYISKFGGIKSRLCNKLSKEIWMLCIENGIWLTISHIPGIQNTLADKKSRKFNDQLEWKLNPKVFSKIGMILQKPDIDLFASRLNFQVEKFCSWEPDPLATFVNAFTLDWSMFKCVYIFPPFSLLNRCIRKIKTDKVTAIVIAPYWPTQVWFPALMEILTDNPVIIPKKKNLLTLPHSGESHPLSRKLNLIACRVSGKTFEVEDFLKRQQKFSCLRGGAPLRNNIKFTSENGLFTVMKEKLIKFVPLWKT